MKKKVLLFVICVASLLGGCKNDVNNSKIILPETVGVLEECEKQQEGRPEIVLSGESILEVKIDNQKSYKTFIKQIEEYKDCAILYIDLLGSNTIVYLDEILSQNNFVIVEISNGGVLSAKDMEVCKETNLRDLQLKYMFRIDNCVLDLFDSLETVLLWTDQSFEGQELNRGNEINPYGVWHIDKVVLQSRMYTGSVMDGDLEENIYDPEDYIGMEVEYHPEYFRLGSEKYIDPKYVITNTTVKEVNEDGKFYNPNLYEFLLNEKIEIFDAEKFDYLAEAPLFQVEVEFDEEASYGDFGFIPIGTQFIMLNERTMIIGLWGKILLAHKM